MSENSQSGSLPDVNVPNEVSAVLTFATSAMTTAIEGSAPGVNPAPFNRSFAAPWASSKRP
jgi:hypothetical protein